MGGKNKLIWRVQQLNRTRFSQKVQVNKVILYMNLTHCQQQCDVMMDGRS